MQALHMLEVTSGTGSQWLDLICSDFPVAACAIRSLHPASQTAGPFDVILKSICSGSRRDTPRWHVKGARMARTHFVCVEHIASFFNSDILKDFQCWYKNFCKIELIWLKDICIDLTKWYSLLVLSNCVYSCVHGTSLPPRGQCAHSRNRRYLFLYITFYRNYLRYSHWTWLLIYFAVVLPSYISSWVFKDSMIIIFFIARNGSQRSKVSPQSAMMSENRRTK